MDIQYFYLLNISETCFPSRQNLEHTLNIHCGALPLLPWWLLTVIFHLYSRMASKPHMHIQYVTTAAPISSTTTLPNLRALLFCLRLLLFLDRNPQPPSGFNLTGRLGQSSVFWPRCWTSQQSDKNSACRSQTASAKLLNAQRYTLSQPRITTGTDA